MLQDLHSSLSYGYSCQLWAEQVSRLVHPLVKLEGKWGVFILITSILSMQLWGEVTQWPCGEEDILEMWVEKRLEMKLLGECSRLPRMVRAHLSFGPVFEVGLAIPAVRPPQDHWACVGSGVKQAERWTEVLLGEYNFGREGQGRWGCL